MGNNNYDEICILLLCAIAPLGFALLFSNLEFSVTGYVVLIVVSMLFWIATLGIRDFDCNIIIGTLITIVYLILLSMTIFINYPLDNMIYICLFTILLICMFIFFVINYRKSNYLK